MDVEIVILTEASQKKTSVIRSHLYVGSKTHGTFESIYKAETESQINQ